jgi:hypothetical protein
MKIYEDITPALQGILRSWSTGDTSCWVSFRIDRAKLEGVREKWMEAYGTGLSAEKRRWRRSKGLPTAWACALPVLGNPYQVECVLLASSEAVTVNIGPFSREKWVVRPPEVSDFVIVKEPRERRDYAWTWRIQDRQAALLEQHMSALVKSGDHIAVKVEAEHWIRFYPMFGGVRRQLRRMVRSGEKLWLATRKSLWPGPNSETLPMMVGFRNESPGGLKT